jgi:DNA-binding beta-propeller fold protein YncE
MNRRQFLATSALGVLAAQRAVAAAPPRSLVLVTADTEAHVAVVDPVTGAVVRRIRTHELPRSIEAVAGSVALVAHSELGRLTLIDAARGTATLVAARVGEPRYAAVHRDERHAIITDSARGELIVLDVRTARIVRRIAVGDGARHLGIHPSGAVLWTALGTKARDLAVVRFLEDPLERVRVRRLRPPFLAHDVVFSPDGRRVWVTSGDRRRIAIYDVTGALLRVIAADAAPQHVAFGRTVAYVASGDDGTMRVHRFDGTPLRESTIPRGSFNVTRAAGHVVTPSLSRGTLVVLDRNGVVRRTVRVAAAAHDACLVMA